MPYTLKIPQGDRKNIFKLLIDSQKGGTNTNIDEARLPLQQAPVSQNLIQVQDGLWQTRWGTGYYGNELSAESSLDGATEYIDSSGNRELVVVGGTTGKVYKSTNNGSSWVEITGATMTAGNQCFFLQISNQLWITNNTDRLTIYDGSTLTRNTQLSAPTGVTATRGAGLSAGSYVYYYSIVALNEVGFTNGSTEAQEDVDILRDNWSASDETIELSWNTVSGATRYEIYISDESGAQVYLDSTTTNSYSDTGAAAVNIYREVPSDNTTGGPILGKMTLSGNRVWGIDKENQRTVFGGVGQYQSYFSVFYGGGYAELESGGRETPEAVEHYRTGKGDSVATVFTSSPDGKGSIWQIAFDSITIGSTTITIPTPVKVVGSIGSSSALGTVNADDNILSPNKKGIYALKNKAQLFNVLATEEQTVNIRPSYRDLSGSMISNMAGYYYEAKAFFSASIGGTENDRTFLYDTERNNWNWNWTIGFNQFFEYTDDNDETRFLAIMPGENRLVEIDERYLTDLGSGFTTQWLSPLIHADQKDKTKFAFVDDVIVELGRPVGTIKLEVLGIEKEKGYSSLTSRDITDSVSSVDFANALWGDYSWSDDDATPTSFSQATVKKRIRVNKLLNAMQFKISSTQASTQYTILSIMARGRYVPVQPPSSWNN